MNEVNPTNFTGFNFFINTSYILLTLTFNNNLVKDKINNLIGKIIILRENKEVDLFELTKLLNLMERDKLNIVALYPLDVLENINYINIKEPSYVKYLEIGANDFITHCINNSSFNFLEYNNNTIYVIKEGSYIDAKNIFSKINDFDTNIGRGDSQKAHLLSPLDFRLSCYMMAMLKFDYKYITYLNSFNIISKDRYLPFIEIKNSIKK